MSEEYLGWEREEKGVTSIQQIGLLSPQALLKEGLSHSKSFCFPSQPALSASSTTTSPYTTQGGQRGTGFESTMSSPIQPGADTDVLLWKGWGKETYTVL